MPQNDEPTENSKPSVKVEFGARAELRAEIKAEIPPASMGRLLEALTDIIRPFTERRGLHADRIRLQREEILIQIMEKAKRRLEIEEEEIRPVSNKFLGPFIEHASLEDEKSELAEKWANLLANASMNNAENYTWCISILSELNSRDACLLDVMYQHRGYHGTVEFDRYTRIQVEAQFREAVGEQDGINPFTDFEALHSRLDGVTDYVRGYHGKNIPNTNEVAFEFESDEGVLSRLESSGLVWMFAESLLLRERGRDISERCFFVAASLTPKGLAFVRACGDKKD